MKNARSFFTRVCHSPIPRRSAILFALVMMAWSGFAFCDDIHDAAAKGDLAEVTALLKRNPHEVNAHQPGGMTPLDWAAANGHADVVKLLLEKKAHVNPERGPSNAWPLLFAAANGHADVVKLLLDAGAKVDMGARTFINVTVGSPVLGAGPGTALMAAAANGHADVVKLLLDAGGKVKAHDFEYGTALVRAAESGHADVVKLLLDAGANKEAFAVDNTNFTYPWHGSIKDLKYLHPGESFTGVGLHGVSITATMTVTATMTGGGSIGVIYVNVSGRLEKTALVLAAQNGHADVVKLLVDAGANMNGRTELCTGRVGPTGLVPRLPHFIYFSVNETALQAARQANHQDIVDLLTTAGAKE